MRFAARFVLPLLLIVTSLSLLAGPSAGDIIFAIPEQGLITLGVFDKSGHLVRTLHALEGEEAFRVAVNGYRTTWDGLDDEGKQVPAGSYHIRGYLVGDVTTSGREFHFNDWITSEEDPSLGHLGDFSLLPGGDVILLGSTPAGEWFCARYSPGRGFVWVGDFCASRPLFAVGGNNVILRGAGDWRLFGLETGRPAQVFPASPGTPPQALAASGNDVWEACGASLLRPGLAGLPPGEDRPAPAVFTVLDASRTQIAGASPDGLWLSKQGSTFEKIPLPVVVKSLSFGTEGTIWFTGTSRDAAAQPVVGQTDATGELLRTLALEDGGLRPVKIHALRGADTFAVVDESPERQRLRVLTRAEGTWTILWEREIRASAAFGFLGSQAVADVGATPQTTSLRFRLEENPLTGERQEITLHAKADCHGTRLVTEDGLPLVQISNRGDVTRLVLHRGESADSLLLLQGNGAVVEEFGVEGLSHIFPLNAGSLERP